jgi:predicted RNA-binding Zn ribbon-like protein
MLYYERMEPTTDTPPPLDDDTPADLTGLINFANSRASSRRPERFGTPADAAAFLSHCELGYDGGRLSGQDTARLQRLRDAIVDAVKEPTDARAWDTINELAGTAPLRLHIASGHTATLEPANTNPTDAVVARLLDQIARAVTTGRWNRLGACAQCQRVFYDTTRSHTRRWCSYATCGNKANVAAYRSRNRS